MTLKQFSQNIITHHDHINEATDRLINWRIKKHHEGNSGQRTTTTKRGGSGGTRSGNDGAAAREMAAGRNGAASARPDDPSVYAKRSFPNYCPS
jgi:hypothetical protein